MTQTRPICSIKGCTKPCQKTSQISKKTGEPCYRRQCGHHILLQRAKNAGYKSITEYTRAVKLRLAKKHGFKSVTAYNNSVKLQVAKRQGFKSIAEYTRHKVEDLCKQRGISRSDYSDLSHPYRKYKKKYCENRDGSVLGFKCRATIRIKSQLQLDHKNGDPTDNRPRNFQTLCACCHILKTYQNKDHLSPGRKTLAK